MSGETLLGDNSKIDGEEVTLGKNIRIGKNTNLAGKRIQIEDHVTIGDNTRIWARNIFIGFGSRVDGGCQIILPGDDGSFVLRDNCIIGSDSKILVPVFEAGDYLTIHNHALVNGLKPVRLGHNVWIGQNCILNSNENLTIGNGVGLGAYSCVYTHGFFGELLEGCQVYKVAPVVIEDDAWIVGSFNIISPGVTVGRRAIILTGSVLTKDAPPFSCWGGNPARNITDKIPTYRTVSIDEKYEMMKRYMDEFIERYYPGNAVRTGEGWRIETGGTAMEIQFLPELTDETSETGQSTKVIFTKRNRAKKRFLDTTVFELDAKCYTKTRARIEIEIIRFLSSNKARFLPV